MPKIQTKLPGAPPVGPIKFAQRIQRGLVGITRKMGPSQFALLDLVMAHWRTQALTCMVRVGVVEALGRRTRTTADLAKELNLDEGGLYRLLRAIARDGLLDEKCDRSFSLNSITQPLLKDASNSMRNVVLQTGSPLTNKLWNELDHSVRTGESAWSKFFEGDLWSYLDEHPEEGEIFHSAMGELTRDGAMGYAKAYDFGQHESVVDLGGGAGLLLSAILMTHPNVRGFDYDFELALKESAATFRKFGVAERAESLVGNMLESIPEGEGAYVAKNILHGLDDSSLIEAMKMWRGSMAKNSKLIVIDIVVPEPKGAYMQYLDLMMLLSSGGRERTEPEFRDLFRITGFRLEEIIATISPMSVIVATPDG